MAYRATVRDDGELTIPVDLPEDLGWRVGDDGEIELAESGLIVRRRPDDQSCD